MPKKTDTKTADKFKLEQIVQLLKFALTLEDQEVIQSTIESVVDLLQDMIMEINNDI